MYILEKLFKSINNELHASDWVDIPKEFIPEIRMYLLLTPSIKKDTGNLLTNYYYYVNLSEYEINLTLFFESKGHGLQVHTSVLGRLIQLYNQE